VNKLFPMITRGKNLPPELWLVAYEPDGTIKPHAGPFTVPDAFAESLDDAIGLPSTHTPPSRRGSRQK
jgi:hypothetical protein